MVGSGRDTAANLFRRERSRKANSPRTLGPQSGCALSALHSRENRAQGHGAPAPSFATRTAFELEMGRVAFKNNWEVFLPRRKFGLAMPDRRACVGLLPMRSHPET